MPNEVVFNISESRLKDLLNEFSHLVVSLDFSMGLAGNPRKYGHESLAVVGADDLIKILKTHCTEEEIISK